MEAKTLYKVSEVANLLDALDEKEEIQKIAEGFIKLLLTKGTMDLPQGEAQARLLRLCEGAIDKIGDILVDEINKQWKKKGWHPHIG